MAFVDDIIIDNQRDRFRPAVTRFQVLKQADKQHRTYAVTANVTDFARSAVQRARQHRFLD